MVERSWQRGLAVAVDLWRLQRAQRGSPERLPRLREARLQAIVAHAAATVPFYRERFAAGGIRPEDIRTPRDLAALPVTTKADLQAAGPEGRTSTAVAAEDLDTGMTSGSTGQPFMFSRDPRAMRLRKALFLRALLATGYRPPDRVLLFDAPRENLPPSWLRWSYCRATEPLEVQYATLARVKPQILYAARPTTLLLLVDHARRNGLPLPRPRALISTGETLGQESRAILEDAFGTRVFDVYGAVEIGTIAWECRTHAGLHVAEDVVILELLPSGFDGLGRVVLTSLENRGMPLLRYDTGDLAVAGPTGPCACGSTFTRLGRIEGRLVDCLQRRDGQFVPPSRLEHAVRRLDGVQRFQIVQEGFGRVLVRFQGSGGVDTLQQAEQAVAGLVGEEVEVTAVWVPSVEPAPGQKFRLVERRAGPSAS